MHESLGIILNITPYSESDLVVRAMTKTHGKLSFMARHAKKSKKRFGGNLDIFQRAYFQFGSIGSGLVSLSSCNPQPSFWGIRESLEKISCASLICESLDALIPNGAGHPEVFYNVLELSLEALHQAKSNRETLRACYLGLSGMLSEAGFLDNTHVKTPSAKALMDLVKQLENSSERTFKSLPSVVQAINSLKAA